MLLTFMLLKHQVTLACYQATRIDDMASKLLLYKVGVWGMGISYVLCDGHKAHAPIKPLRTLLGLYSQHGEFLG